MADAPRRQRSLWPREHGAYAQLLAPLATALVVVRPTVAAGLLAVAAFCAFLANEPLLVMLGHRGKRLLADAGKRAEKRLTILASLAAVAGIAGLALAPRALTIAAIVAVPAVVTVVLAWRRLERTPIGEAVAAVTLSGAGAPVLVAAGASQRTALMIWAAWAIGYVCTVFAVHRVIARHREHASLHDTIIGLVLGAATIGAITLLGRGSLIGAATPLALASFLLVARPPRASYLRTIGIVLVVASVATGALAWATL